MNNTEELATLAEENFVAGFKFGVVATLGGILLHKAYKRGVVSINLKKVRDTTDR